MAGVCIYLMLEAAVVLMGPGERLVLLHKLQNGGLQPLHLALIFSTQIPGGGGSGGW